MRKSLKQKGFTLVEILIVIVILAILAALVIPRLLHQTDKAEIAEAQNTLGILRRGIIQYTDSTGNAEPKITCSHGTDCDSTVEPNLTLIGVSKIPAGKYGYYCDSGVCFAELGASPTAALAAGTGTWVSVNIDNGLFTCDGKTYTEVGGAGPTPKGCTTNT